MMRRALASLAFSAALAACNAVAGIADYREGTPGGPNAPGADGGVDGASASGGDGAAPVGIDGGSDGAVDLPPGCVPVTLTVVASASGAYVGVEVRDPPALAQKIPVGERRVMCGATGLLLDLRGDPDDTHAAHRWDGTPCGIDARCRFTVTGPADVTVHLQ